MQEEAHFMVGRRSVRLGGLVCFPNIILVDSATLFGTPYAIAFDSVKPNAASNLYQKGCDGD